MLYKKRWGIQAISCLIFEFLAICLDPFDPRGANMGFDLVWMFWNGEEGQLAKDGMLSLGRPGHYVWFGLLVGSFCRGTNLVLNTADPSIFVCQFNWFLFFFVLFLKKKYPLTFFLHIINFSMVMVLHSFLYGFVAFPCFRERGASGQENFASCLIWIIWKIGSYTFKGGALLCQICVSLVAICFAISTTVYIFQQ